MDASNATAWVTVATLFFSLAGLAGIVPALISPMMFDGPGSEKSLLRKVFFWSVFTFPPACLFSVAFAWLLYWTGCRSAACIVAGAPAANLAAGASAIALLGLFRCCNVRSKPSSIHR